MCWLSRNNHLYIPRSHPTECVYCSAQSFCFLEKQNFLNRKLALVGRVRFPAGLRCVFSSDPAVSSSIFVGAEREENLIKTFFLQVSTWRRQCGYLPRTSWKWPENKTNRVRRHLGDKMFSTVAKSVSGSQCLCSTKFVFLSQEHTDIHDTHKHDFLHKKNNKWRENNYFNIRQVLCFHYCKFYTVLQQVHKLATRRSLPLNCFLVVREKTNTAYF